MLTAKTIVLLILKAKHQFYTARDYVEIEYRSIFLSYQNENEEPHMTKVIACAHEKEGVGKTTTTVNLGVGLARQGKKVLLLDADPQGDLSKCLGVKDTKELTIPSLPLWTT